MSSRSRALPACHYFPLAGFAPMQVALAHLRENIAAGQLALSRQAVSQLDRIAAAPSVGSP